jgi:CBS domain-containing protein
VPRVAKELITAEPLTVAAATPVLEVQHLLVLAQTTGMPVVEEDGRVIGIVSAIDVLRAMDQVLDPDLDDGETDDIFEPLRALTARDIASVELVWIDPETPVSEVAAQMRDTGVRRVLVGVGGKLEGMLTPYELLTEIA